MMLLKVGSLLCILGVAFSEITVNQVDRTLDLSTQLVKIKEKWTFESSSSASSVEVSIDENLMDKVAFVGAMTDKTYLRVTESKIAPKKGGKSWKIDLKKSISAGGSASVVVEWILGKAVEMFPKEITQREKQLVLFNGNHYVYSPYKVKSQTTKVELPNNKVESYSKNLKPTSLSDTVITYGPYVNTEPYSQEPLSLHYENNSPFLVVSRLERTVEVSMWGNIAIEEVVDIRHAGAKLSGSFSRYEFQRENSGVSSVKSFKTVLPAAASDVYYRDDIGNISTSALRTMDDSVELELRPRFPLFGGWKTHYTIGYNVPSYEYLFTKGDQFALNMRLLDHIYDDMLVEEMTLKIILPEGSKVGKLHSPFPTLRKGDTLHYTYLDTKGRPVINIENVDFLTEKHIQDFQLEFEFPRLSMVNEPALLVIAFFTFFALAIIYVRLDFSITKDEGVEAKMKVAGVCEKIVNMQEKRNAHYQSFEDALSKLKSSKDNGAFQTSLKKINGDHKNETQNIADSVPAIKAISAEMAEKVLELQKLDRTYREQQLTQSQLVEKLVTGKLNKNQFIDQESGIQKKKSEIFEKIENICSTLRSI